MLDIYFTILQPTSFFSISVYYSINENSSSFKHLDASSKSKSQRIRVHTTRIDSRPINEVQEGCSIVSIQNLDSPFKYHNLDFTFRSRWQTMLGRSVIDVDVGPDSTFESGFLVVIKRANTECYCNGTGYDLRIHGDNDYHIEHGSRFAGITSSAKEQDYESYLNISVLISVVDNDIQTASWSILGGMIVLLVVSTALSWIIPSLSMIGNVHNKFQSDIRHNPKIRPSIINMPSIDDSHQISITSQNKSFIAPASRVNSRTMDSSIHGEENLNENSSQKTESTVVSCDNSVLEGVQCPIQDEIISLKNHITAFPPMKDVECIYIEVGSELEAIEEDVFDTVDIAEKRKSNFAYQRTSLPVSADVKATIKSTFNIDKEKSIRIIARTTKKKRIERRRRASPKLEDLATKCNAIAYPKTLNLKSNMYCWIISIVGVFYIVPVIQLMYDAQLISKQTGSEDVCYYNFLCRRTSSMFADYGHVFSNIFYILFGICFIFLVWIRRHRRRNAMLEIYFETKNIIEESTRNEITRKYAGKNSEFLNQCGIPEQYGIFYAMGVALIFEGILSACYHGCPVDESFQFDTTFMYMIMVLIYLKMYQFRHPDITANAYKPFAFITVMIVFEATGYYWSYYLPFGVFLSIFITVFMIVIYISGLDLYFKGDLLETIKEVCGMTRDQPKMNIAFFDTETGASRRDIYYLLMIILNAALALFFIVDFYAMKISRSVISIYLMAIFALNMTAYATRYVFTKMYYSKWKKRTSESLSWTCCIYIIIWATTAVIGIYFFVQPEKRPENSPSMSRNLNQECTILFFDYHDIWHMISSTSLFFCFMILITLEDNNIAKMAFNTYMISLETIKSKFHKSDK